MSPRTMKAVVTTQPRRRSMHWKTLPVPRVRPDEVLVKVQVTSICGTDLHIYNWDPWARGRIRTPLVQGHEWAGRIEAVGRQVRGLHAGDYVSGEGHIPDWTCTTCRGGAPHVCPNVSILGIHRQGSFAQFLPVPARNIVRNPSSLPLELATLQDPLGNAVQTVWSADVKGKTVAVFGLGPIGLMAITVCKALGAKRVLAVGRTNRLRLDLARTVGADRVFGSRDDVLARLRDETHGEGVDEVLEFSGAEAALQNGIAALRPTGGLHVLGLFPRDLRLDVNTVVHRALRIVGIHGRRMFEDWRLMQRLLRGGKLDLEPIITHRLRLEDFEEGFQAMDGGRSGKVVMFVD